MFPFSALVGQEDLKQALLVSAVNPEIGGLLISGDKGTAKSTAVRALADLLPDIAVAPDCQFNCQPGMPAPSCQICGTVPAAPIGYQRSPFVNLPLGASEDRVIGSLDFERALKGGTKAFQPGLLASAHRGILYIDEVNLLPDHLVDILLDVAASGINKVERESMTLSHPARFTLTGSMNPEEGELRPQFLDRFAMMVEVRAPVETWERAEIVRRRFEFDANPAAFVAAYAASQQLLRRQIETARSLVAAVTVSEERLELITGICSQLGISSLRADICMHGVARTLAALAGRLQVTNEDVGTAAKLVLAHRVRNQSHSSLPPDKRKDLERQLDELMPPEPEDGSTDPPAAEGDDSGPLAEKIFSLSQPQALRKLETALKLRGAEGRRSAARISERGTYVGASRQAGGSLAVDATIRHSVIRNDGRLNVEAEDLHTKIRAGKHGNLILIVVDASGSMAACGRMKAVKGAVVGLLQDAYQRRDLVGVISCRGDDAELLLPPTKSVTFAFERLEQLPAGGTTPLAAALVLALATIAMPRYDQPAPLLVLLTDGRANAGLEKESDPWADTLTVAHAVAKKAIPCLVLDSEAGFVRLKRARALADALGGEYLPLADLTADNLKVVIASHIGLRGR